jgi:AraC-like DNA-binding protein
VRFTRPPSAILRPFVEVLWAIDERAAPAPSARRERVLPTGGMHVAIRLSGDPLHIQDAGDPRRVTIVGPAVVGGARMAPYFRDMWAPAWSIGAQLRPGAAPFLLNAPAGGFAGRHTDLDLVWGADVARLRDRLSEERDPSTQLDILESALATRVTSASRPHPVVARALESLRSSPDVSAAVAHSGYGHRRFVELFREHVGLNPKVYCRLRRFQYALRLAAGPSLSWAAIAAAAGYSDQAHLHREFREFAGLTPGQYRALAPPFPNHVPARVGADRR